MRRALLGLLIFALLPDSATAGAAGDPLEAMRDRHFCRILSYLEEIYRRPGSLKHRYLIAEPDTRREDYVQCLVSPDRAQIYCEAASGRFARPARQLVPPDRLPQLMVLGFDGNPGEGNYRQQHPLAGIADLAHYADLYLRTFHYLYGIGPDSDLYLRAPLVPIAPPPRYRAGADCYAATS
jgi:hypothetical protein